MDFHRRVMLRNLLRVLRKLRTSKAIVFSWDRWYQFFDEDEKADPGLVSSELDIPEDFIPEGFCGTAACVAGACALDPWFRKRGWDIDKAEGSHSALILPGWDSRPVKTCLMEQFHLDSKDAEDLFYGYEDAGVCPTECAGGPDALESAIEVAERLYRETE